MVAWVALGSALGASARWGLGHLLGTSAQVGFPWGTLAINIIGSALIGCYAAIVSADGRWLASPQQRNFVMAGFCGGFTTFSLFTAEVLASIASGKPLLAAAIIVLSVPAWLVGVWGGYLAGQYFNRVGPRHRGDLP
ncbi:camphor resistance protein CrcB [Pseudoxanthomonas wuyuanensis]|uniref:Fluoride-specific ion channel FluC n=2 Tax=Pseudoxanthomonas wuyuanensis TaxID=1073196 RepID=A0A286CYF6_9GAMM|nr:camphor resistance protein CrcB [Pseudoxanthomonas wuyuanensis]